MRKRDSREAMVVSSLVLAIAMGVPIGCTKSDPVAQNPPPTVAPSTVPESESVPQPSPMALPGARGPITTNPVPQPVPASISPAAYTIEPIEIAPETPPDAALQKMEAHYGHNRVVRIVLNFSDGPAPAQTSDWLRSSLYLLESPSLPVSAYINQQGSTATAIVGPVRGLRLLERLLPSSAKGAQYDFKARTLTATVPVAMIPPPAGSPEEAAELMKLSETLAAATDFTTRNNAKDRLQTFRTDSGAATYCQVMNEMLQEGKTGAIDFTISLPRMGPLAERYLLDWLPAGEAKGQLTKTYIIHLLGEFGGPAALTDLPKLAPSLPPMEAQDISAAVAAIERRHQDVKKTEEQARLDDETPFPPPSTPDVKHTVNARYLQDAYHADPGAIREKFGGQVVEITSEVSSLGFNFNDQATVYLRTNEFAGSLSAPTKGKYHNKKIAPGQRITVKGLVDVGFTLSLKDCEVVNTGESSPPEMTAESFGAEFDSPEKQAAGDAKFARQWLVITGKVLEVQGDGNHVVIDTGKPLKIYLSFVGTPDELQKSVKVGQTIEALGKFERSDNTFNYLRFEDSVLCAAPQGP